MPEEQFPWLPVGKLVLNKNPENYFNEMEQVAFGTSVLLMDSTFPMIKCYKDEPSHIQIHKDWCKLFTVTN